MPRCYVVLGGNLGDVPASFRRSVDRLSAADVDIVRLSPIFTTAAVGAASGDSFQNAVVEIRTDLAAGDLLNLLRKTERELGRTRSHRWAPRTIDLDLILYGDEIIHNKRLIVPHPACWYRRFVLDPMCEIADSVDHPQRQMTFGELRERLLPRPLRAGLTGGSDELKASIIAQLSPEFPEAELFEWSPAELDPALILWLGSDTKTPAETLPFEGLPALPRLNAAVPDVPPLQIVAEILASATGSTECDPEPFPGK